MDNRGQLWSLTLGLSVSATTAALELAVVFVLTVVASQAAQAQTLHVLHNFTGQDGAAPYAGLTERQGNLYGDTPFLGPYGAGTVYELQRTGSNCVFNTLYSFTGGDDGYLPEAGVTFGPDGLLYGGTAAGGKGYGVVFSLRPPATFCRSVPCPWTENVLYPFQDGSDGSYDAYSAPVFDRAGNIYGTTPLGGAYGLGTVYQLAPSGNGWREKVIYSFAGPDGFSPVSGIILDSTGNLYSTTLSGGSGNAGTVFELSPLGSGWTEKVIYSFQNGSDGSRPAVALIFDLSGNLYGATSTGGSGGGGTVFKLSPAGDSWTYSLLYSFTGSPNCGPNRGATLALSDAGNLYGTTNCDGTYGYGSIFKLTQSGSRWIYTSLHDFTGGSDGGYPFSNVVFDTNGDLYGTAAFGGDLNCNAPYGCGIVWELTP